MPKKEPEFVVSDRRKFTEEGELRPDSAQEAAQTSAPSAPPPADSSVSSPPPPEKEEEIAPPTQAEQDEQHAEYRKSGAKLDDLLSAGGHGKAEDFEMSFDRLVQSLYVTALVQLGMMVREGEQPRPDIIGARQTIDTLGVLKDKTKGNLTPKEENLLQNALFELRMAFLELTNALTRTPPPGAKPPAK
jgi:hypothetical protein